MKQYTSRQEREHIEAQFDTFMRNAIRNYAKNVTRSITSDERKRRGISLEALDEDCLEFMAVEDRRDFEDGIILQADLKIRITDELLQRLLNGLTERETQVLVLRVAYELSYDEISRKLRITPERAKAYKYHGIKKAKERTEEYGRD